ncbi:MAG: hypothetical protein Q9221_001803 [Calogaya cf. arnoldii]
MPQQGSSTDGKPATSKRADTSNYVIYAKDSTNKDQTTAIGDLLKGVVSDSKNISVHESDLGVAFWGVPLTSDAAKKAGADSNVGAVVQACADDCPDPTGSDDPNDDNATLGAGGSPTTKRSSDNILDGRTHLVKRDDGLANSHKIDPEMVFISLPDQAKLEDYEDFVYDKSAGTNVMVYIIDTGADLRNDDEFSKFVRPNVQWLHAFGAFPQDTTENEIKGVGHGTGVLAKAAGWKHGTAKRSKPVVVRVNKLGDPAAWLDGVIQAYNDWRTNHYTGHETSATIVLNLSWGWKRDSLIKAGYNTEQQINWVLEMRRYLKACVAIGLLPIAPSGNSPKMGPPNVLFAYGNPADVPDMMVAGGIGTDGVLWDRSKTDPPNQGSVIKVYALCYDITIPNAVTGGYRSPAEVEGVSYASGTIAGVGTYFLGLSSLSDSLKDDDPNKRVQKQKEELQAGSCIPRTDDTSICGLNNLADPKKCPPDVPNGFKDSDEVGCKQEGGTSTTPTTEVCVQATPDPDKPAATCTVRNDEGFPSEDPLLEDTFACTNFCYCGTGGKSRVCEIPKT